MKRSVLVAAGTAVGVTAVVSYHAASPSTSLSVASASAGATSAGSTTSSSHTTSAVAPSGSQAAQTTTTSTTTRTSTTSSSAGSSGTRSALGEAVSFQYGELQVKVSERAGRITNVSIAHFEIADPRSQSIDEYAVPQLRQEVLSAQSAHIDGVSGASYTSQAYAQSVQAALDKLK